MDLFAPGELVFTTWNDGSYRLVSGTSIASPQVAAAYALYRAAWPEATTAELRQALLDDVDPVPAFAGKSVTGGRLSIASLAEGALGAVRYTFTSLSVPAGVVTPGITAAGEDAAGDYAVTVGLGMAHEGEIWAVADKDVTLGGATGTTDDAGEVQFDLGTAASLADARPLPHPRARRRPLRADRPAAPRRRRRSAAPSPRRCWWARAAAAGAGRLDDSDGRAVRRLRLGRRSDGSGSDDSGSGGSDAGSGGSGTPAAPARMTRLRRLGPGDPGAGDSGDPGSGDSGSGSGGSGGSGGSDGSGSRRLRTIRAARRTRRRRLRRGRLRRPGSGDSARADSATTPTAPGTARATRLRRLGLRRLRSGLRRTARATAPATVSGQTAPAPDDGGDDHLPGRRAVRDHLDEPDAGERRRRNAGDHHRHRAPGRTAAVRVGDAAAATVVRSSATELVFRAPARAEGSYDVHVFARDGRRQTLPDRADLRRGRRRRWRLRDR